MVGMTDLCAYGLSTAAQIGLGACEVVVRTEAVKGELPEYGIG
jgi:hypothetical protein